MENFNAGTKTPSMNANDLLQIQQALLAKLKPNMSSSHRQNRKSNLLQSKQSSSAARNQPLVNETAYSQATITDSTHTLQNPKKTPLFKKVNIAGLFQNQLKIEQVKLSAKRPESVNSSRQLTNNNSTNVLIKQMQILK